MTFLARLFGNRADPRDALRPLYDAIVAEARDPAWYLDGVPDTPTGRFEMIAAVLALVLLRLEQEGDATAKPASLLTETFIADMDGSVRQMGVGDLMVGKQVGKMMGALGGRLDRMRSGGPLDEAVRRNIFREDAPSDAAVTAVTARLEALRDAIGQHPAADLLTGGWPR